MLGAGLFDEVLGSLHYVPYGDGFSEPPGLHGHRAEAQVVREYLAEVPRVAESDAFSVLAHIDYPAVMGPLDDQTRLISGRSKRSSSARCA